MDQIIVPADVAGPVLCCDEGLSFWGGVDPDTGSIVDAHHPQHGLALAGHVVLMPTSRGSCTGSGVLLGLALAGRAPAALVFREPEDVLTLGAVIADRMFGQRIAVVRLGPAAYDALATASASAGQARIADGRLDCGDVHLTLAPLDEDHLLLSDTDRAMLDGRHGPAVARAMETVRTMAAVQGARDLVDVTRVHIDGCIYASPAFLTFARRMVDMGARVRVPTTTNAISVDHANWRRQGVAESQGAPAAALADAYVEMGAAATFTCAPYLHEPRPEPGEILGWPESNAVIHANSIFGARTAKLPDFLDLCIALTGRVPRAGVYLTEARAPSRIVEVVRPDGADESFWPMLGWLVGQAAPDCIPLIRGLAGSAPTADDLKALCASFGTTSAAPMLHIEGITPEADTAPAPGAETVRLEMADFARLWRQFNGGADKVDLVALGSPHSSAEECRTFAALMEGRRVRDGVSVILTLGRATLAGLRATGLDDRLRRAGVTLVPDLCWCSISEPVFPPSARVLMTNSGKYAHYAPGLCGRAVRFGSLADCAETAVTGHAPDALPVWLRSA